MSNHGRHIRTVVIALAAALLIVTTACSSKPTAKATSKHPSEATATVSNGQQSITVYTDDSYNFYPKTIHATTGTLVLTLTNEAKSSTHNLLFDAGGPTKGIDYLPPGKSKTVTVNLPTAGSFGFNCSFHLSMGMVGTLIVA